MEKINYFNYCAFLTILIILVSTIMRKMTKGQLNRYYIILLVNALLASFFDIMAVACDNKGNVSPAVVYFFHMGYLLIHNFTVPMYTTYVIAFTDTIHIIRKKAFLKYGMFMPYLITFILILTTPLTKKIFSVSDSGKYIRGDWFVIMYISTAIYIILAFYILIKYRGSLPGYRWASLVFIVPLMLVAVAVQYFAPYCPVEMISNAFGLLFISNMVQRPEDIIDIETGANNHNDYTADIKRSFINKKEFSIIYVRLTNFSTLLDILSYEESTTLLQSVFKKLADTILRSQVKSEIYYLNRGVFSLTFDSIYENKIGDIADSINQRLKKTMNLSSMEISLLPYVCIVHCPEDIDNQQSLNAFLNHININSSAGNEVASASDIINGRNYDMLMDMDAIINRAVANHNLHVYYQPIYSIREKRFTSAEALIRLIDDKYGFVPPDIFIPAAEKNGAIHKIGEFVLDSVCEFISSSEFSRLGIEYVEVNLSVVQCMNSNLHDDVLRIMSNHGVSSDKINLEITETSAAYAQDVMLTNITKLARSGISFSLDDFGTGYSNMQRIATLPLSIAKLDKSLATDTYSSKMDLVVKSSIDMIKALDLKIVVEGVETKEMLEKFDKLGCDYIQGYFFSKPLPKDDFVSFVEGYSLP